MDKTNKYLNIIKTIMDAYVASMQANLDEEVYLVEDPIKMNYLIYHHAWRGSSRSYGCILHVRIKNEKIQVEYDGTDEAFAAVFAAAGIPKEDIVLAFHAPAKRPFTGFAEA